MLTRLTSSLKFLLCISIFFASFGVRQIYANASFSISPLIVTLKPAGKNSQQLLTVKHTGGGYEPIAVEISIVKRDLNLTGQVSHKTDESDDNFVIYPAQIILFPGEVQMVNVQWIGDFALDNELVYSIIAKQVPIDLGTADRGQSKSRLELKVLLKYEGLLYVRPPGVSPDVVVESAAPEFGDDNGDDDGEPHLIVMLYNRGSARQKINRISLTVTPLDKNGQPLVDKSIVYAPQMPKKLINHSLYAGYRRRCELPWPEGVPVGPVQVSVSCK